MGANLGAGRANLLAAWQRLGVTPGVTPGRLSRPWRSEPVGVATAAWFTNAAGELLVELGPEELLAILLRIEAELGRDRVSQGEDRPIDLDLLLHGEMILDLPHCRVPHPALARRRFVLEPLRELAPELVEPRSGSTISRLAELAAGSGQKLAPLSWQQEDILCTP
ncbi:2-amino-4-hydroxy-6-hydroxymethyldihydropteridine diphosphokinase [Desulfurivibrio sp. D14AmB]|uniref:2-amino-4-hydroxy-6- hydroxymethyldihydropteridine diphosphokinase n=1 Tax=Desulfurivibrio sp. D14AmB TaxID=3374370 RepID=UPI00376EB130